MPYFCIRLSRESSRPLPLPQYPTTASSCIIPSKRAPLAAPEAPRIYRITGKTHHHRFSQSASVFPHSFDTIKNQPLGPYVDAHFTNSPSSALVHLCARIFLESCWPTADRSKSRVSARDATRMRNRMNRMDFLLITAGNRHFAFR